MPRRLTALKIREVSSVDRGAGEGVHVVLHKRAPLTPEQAAAAVETYMKREFSSKERKKLSASGAAMPGGGFPISNADDLENAIRAIGRAKDPAAAKKHIISRARSLGASGKIPAEWRGKAERRLAKAFGKITAALAKADDDEAAEDFNAEIGEMQSLDFGEGVIEAIEDACKALKHSIESIMEDDGTADKGSAIRDS